MNFKQWNEIAELIGMAAVVGSLIFVGWQMRQAQEIALSAAYQARADTSIAIRNMLFESDTLLSAVTKTLNARSAELTPEEYVSLQFYFWTEMTNLENIHFQLCERIFSRRTVASQLGRLEIFTVDGDASGDLGTRNEFARIF